jgi:pyruvate-ferredoxin/flavodoxin oxidoreductase
VIAVEQVRSISANCERPKEQSAMAVTPTATAALPVTVTIDANEAAASVAHRLSEVIAIYPITPSSTMGELSDYWSAHGRKNIWGDVPHVIEMQSEGGAAGAVHGALQAGSLATTFTASQGLLLMIPNMYKIAGELTPFTMHVTARTLATHALSIFGDHSDVMACRQTGFAMLCSNSVQEAHDFALVAHAATLRSRIPFMHFFDGFRTSHEIGRIKQLSDDDLHALIDEEAVAAHRMRALSPDHPVIRGTAQNPDAFFQAREACNLFYQNLPSIVCEAFEKLAVVTGRKYQLFDYVGDPQAERVIIAMGSGAEVIEETVEHLVARGERVGLVKVRLYRPFSIDSLINALPLSVKKIAVLDRTKEPGGVGEPLFLDVVAALQNTTRISPVVVGGRYGLSSKEFTPAMVLAVYDELTNDQPKREFTVGIIDDVTHLSLPVDDSFDLEPDDVNRAIFFGLGADGTVGANKNTIKIIGTATEKYVQAYFVYDSKKSGATTVSHLRFGPRPIKSSYLIKDAHFVGVHQFNFIDKYDVVEKCRRGGVLLLNSAASVEKVWEQFPREMQNAIVEKQLRVYVIDAYKVAREAGVGGRINTIMQTCHFKLSPEILPFEQAVDEIKKAIVKTYGGKGAEIVQKNLAAVDLAPENLHEVKYPEKATTMRFRPPTVSDNAPDFVKRVTAVMLAGKGDLLPVSAFPVDGTWPTSTTRWEKRNIAVEIPSWDEKLCIQCNKCALVCPHAAIRAKVYDIADLHGAPTDFKSVDFKDKDLKGKKYTIQVAPEDCTGCTLCARVCPAKDKGNPRHKALDMTFHKDRVEVERINFDFFLHIPEVDRKTVKLDVKGSQLLQPLFEFSGACTGCGETPYVKLVTQLFGDRALIANATGCSSIYGGNLPSTPYCTNGDGRGPAWSNSLFEDNAEFGLGLRLSVDQQREQAQTLLKLLASQVGDELATAILEAEEVTEAGIAAQRERVAILREKLRGIDSPAAKRLFLLADALVRKSVWIFGGDGWAYDIGFGGLDHVIASGRDVNILVLDTEVYSNTGGQQSKATPIGASAKFASSGKAIPKKDLGAIAMTYGNVYVAQIAFGAKDVHTVKAIQEAESYRGPSIVIAYSHCIAHGYDLANGLDQQKLAVETGYWPLFRYDPRLKDEGKNPFQLDSTPPKGFVSQYMRNETRFRSVEREYPQRFAELSKAAQQFVTDRYARYQQIASANGNGNGHAKVEAPVATIEAPAKPQAEVAPPAKNAPLADAPAKTQATPAPVANGEATSTPAVSSQPKLHGAQERPLRIVMSAGKDD